MNAPSYLTAPPIRSRRGEPTWEIALLYPRQGEWTEQDYLALETNRIVELSDGCLEVQLDDCDPMPPARSKPGDPAWEVALLLPFQGEWTEEGYLALDARTNRLIELSDGCLEFLPMPTVYHQRIAEFLFLALRAFVIARGLGEVKHAPMPVRLWPGKLREPDVVFFRLERLADPHGYPAGADVAMEVVSEGDRDRKRDLETKRQEYAEAGIGEYWIVDPQEQTITVLTLAAKSYREHGVFSPGQIAASALLMGFELGVQEVFAAGLQPPKA